MSYEPSIIELEPLLYCPIYVFGETGPLDIINNSISTINGPFTIEKSKNFPHRSVILEQSSFIDVEIGGVQDMFELPVSYSFWFNREGSPGPIFSVGQESEGFGISVNENNNLVVFYDGINSDTLIESVEDRFHLITVSIDGFFNGEDGEGFYDPTVTVYFDGNPVYITENFSFPADYDIFFNSFYGQPGQSETKISQYFILPIAVDDIQARSLYNLGVLGRDIFQIDSETTVSYTDQNQITLQTSWQAYGIVTGKQ